MSRSPDCQANPVAARRVNVEVTRALAELAADARLVFFSSDLVFDGRQGNYAESAAPNPLSVYGETKAAAEREVLAYPRHLVVRTSLNGGVSRMGDRAFNEELRRTWREGRSVRLFTDEFRSPAHARVTARAVWELALREWGGICHVAGTERLSRHEIGLLVAGRCPELRPQVEAGRLAEYAGAPRPPDTSLDCRLAQGRLSFRLPGLREWLAAHPDELF